MSDWQKTNRDAYFYYLCRLPANTSGAQIVAHQSYPSAFLNEINKEVAASRLTHLCLSNMHPTYIRMFTCRTVRQWSLVIIRSVVLTCMNGYRNQEHHTLLSFSSSIVQPFVHRRSWKVSSSLCCCKTLSTLGSRRITHQPSLFQIRHTHYLLTIRRLYESKYFRLLMWWMFYLVVGLLDLVIRTMITKRHLPTRRLYTSTTGCWCERSIQLFGFSIWWSELDQSNDDDFQAPQATFGSCQMHNPAFVPPSQARMDEYRIYESVYKCTERFTISYW